MNNVLMWVAGAVALVFCALIAVPPIIDWNQYRGVFEEEASRLVGREVRVGGKVNLRILPVPYVRFEKVRIADAAGIAGSFIRVENFTLLLSVPPLLRGIIEARQLELDQPTLRLRFDKGGGGNWQKLNVRSQDLAFVPSGFALQSALIRDGSIVLEADNGRELSRIGGIRGELVARALRGPYRFVGQAEIAHTPLDLRLATAEPDRDGDVSLTASAISPSSGAKHTFKGRLSAIATTPKLTGELTSRAPLNFRAGRDAGAFMFDLSASLHADHRAARLDQLTISFDSAGRPQQLAGNITTTWQDQLTIAGRLRSKWLDLDAITGNRTRELPFRAIELLAGGGFDIGADGNSRIEVEIDQANLGGEIVSGLGVRIVHADNEIRVDRVIAGLPGRTRLRADGLLRMTAPGLEWQGHALVDGHNFGQFLKWAWPGGLEVSGKSAGKFTLSSDLSYLPGKVEFNNALTTIASRTSRGSATYSYAARPLLTVDWQGDSIDLSGFGDRVLSNENIAALLGFEFPHPDTTSKLRRRLQDADFDLRLQAGEIFDGSRTLREVDILFSRTASSLRIGKSHLTIEPELTISLEGALANIDKDPDWRINGSVRARSEEGFAAAAALVQLATGKTDFYRGVAAAYPLNLAVSSVSSQANGQRTTTFVADGALRSGRLRLRAETSGPASKWRNNPLRLDLKLDGSQVDRLLVGFVQGLPARSSMASKLPLDRPSPARQPRPSFLRANLHGVPAQGLQLALAMVSPSARLRIEAQGNTDKRGGDIVWSGKGEGRIIDVGPIAHLLEPGARRLFSRPVAAGGAFLFREISAGWAVEPVDFRISDSRLTGVLNVNHAGDGTARPKLTGSLNVDQLSAPALLAALVSPPSDHASGAGSLDNDGVASVWPEQPFDLTAAGLMDIDIGLRVARMRLGDKLDISDAKLELKTSDGKLALNRMTGRMLAGDLDANLHIAPAAAGAKFSAAVSLRGAEIQRLVSVRQPGQVAGQFSTSLKVEAQALSPRAMITGLRGAGRLDLKQARLPGMETDALTAIADGVVIGDIGPDQLAARLSEIVTGGGVDIGSQSASLKIADGALEVGELVRRIGRARMINRTSVDIVGLAIDSQWTIDTVLKKALEPGIEPKPLPAVQISYTGPLAELSLIQPAVNTGNLQRELTVRKMEHDVRRLERLRREDEKRAKAESVRLRNLELKRRRALEAEVRKRSRLIVPSAGRVPRVPAPPRTTAPSAVAPPTATGTVTRETLPLPQPPTGPGSAAPATFNAGTVMSQPAAPPTPRPPVQQRQNRQPWNPFDNGN